MKKRLFPVLISSAVICSLCLPAAVSADVHGDGYDEGYEAGYQAAMEEIYGPGGYDGDCEGDYGPGGYDDRYYDDYGYEDDYYDENGDSIGSAFMGMVEDFFGYSDGDEYGDDYYYDDDYHSNSTQADESELMTWNTGIGSAQELDGNIVVVSIYVNDKKTSWDFSDESDTATRSDTLNYLNLATAWISEQGQAWGSNPVFYCDWTQLNDLYYEASISADVTSDDDDTFTELCEYIEANIDSDALLAEYGADSIVYMTFYNTPYSNDSVSYTYPYDDEEEYPYEICYIMVRSEGEVEAPAAYAHEMLHTFGAPDLYTSADPEYNYNIVNNFVEYCETNYPNEIMMTTYDVDTNESYYDRISNELTHITAYYIGWTDECEEVEEFNLQPSQYVLTGR